MADQETAAALLGEAIDRRAAGDIQGALERARLARDALPVDAPRTLRGQVELTLGNALADSEEYDAADAALAIAGEHFLAAGCRTEYAQAQVSRGRVLAERGLTEAAIAFFSELRPMKLPPSLRSQVLNNLGVLNRQVGNLSEAIDYLIQDANLCADIGDGYGAAVAHYNLAGAFSTAERTEEASAHAMIASRLFGASGRQDLSDQALAYARAAGDAARTADEDES